MTLPAHARALLDDLFAARDTIDTLISGIERFYAADDLPDAPRERRTKSTKLTQPDSTPWVASPSTGHETNGHAAPPQAPSASPALPSEPPSGNRSEDILRVLKKAPPVGLSCTDIVRAVFPAARVSELKPLTVKFYGTLQAMVKNGLVVEDSRLYTIARKEGGAS